MPYNLDVKKMTKEEWSYNNCRERSLYILQNYNKTEKQLRDKLKQSKKYSEEIIDKTITFLKKHHFLDDLSFAKRYVETHISKYSKKVIKEKLYIKGIKKNIIDKVINDENIVFDEMNIISKLLLKKCPEFYDKVNDMDIKEKNKILSFLLRKGFSYDDVLDVMNHKK